MSPSCCVGQVFPRLATQVIFKEKEPVTNVTSTRYPSPERAAGRGVLVNSRERDIASRVVQMRAPRAIYFFSWGGMNMQVTDPG